LGGLSDRSAANAASQFVASNPLSIAVVMISGASLVFESPEQREVAGMRILRKTDSLSRARHQGEKPLGAACH
jgi:hypothetical protein